MNNEKRKTLIVSALGLIISIVGVSYAFFMAKVNGNESESTVYGVAANLTIEFREGTRQISASDIFPGWSAIKKFYVKNNSASEGEYSLKIFDVENGFMEESISFEITSTNGGANIEKRNLPASDETLKDVIKIAGNTMQEYTVTVYYNNLDVDQSADLGQSFTFKIGIEEAIKPAPKGWYTASNGTLLARIRANYKTATAPLTTPGQETSAENEAVMAATEDDYGISFYFRGNVQNNYVAFAGMCWRIVRVTGDGSIKLVLYNYSSDDCTETGDTLAFARYSGETYETAFNTNSDYYDAYIGFMYGDINGKTYAAIHENKNKSTILANLEAWYENNIAKYADNLADTIWCNDKSTEVDGISYFEQLPYYGAYNRYRSSKPSLICPDDSNGGKLSKFTADDDVNGNGDLDYKIGLLTLDEVVYAGSGGIGLTASYLKTNTGDFWWTLSPASFDASNYAYVFSIGGAGGIYSHFEVDGTFALRPAISLKNATTITSGTGTASSPFVVS